MKVMLSSVEQGAQKEAMKVMLLWHLMSYWYLRGDLDFARRIRDCSDSIMIDSGAHTLQKNARVDFVQYTHDYAAFIKEFDRDNVIGYFEMDVDNIIGYDKVLELRHILQTESGCPDKIIPVWHKNRGIDGFKKMCEEHTIVAITSNHGDMSMSSIASFVKYAHSQGVKVHGLGITNREILDKVPFDFVDSSSWVQDTIYGRVAGKRVSRRYSNECRTEAFIRNYKYYQEKQLFYYNYWRNLSKE